MALGCVTLAIALASSGFCAARTICDIGPPTTWLLEALGNSISSGA
jgi:hypothetical protein